MADLGAPQLTPTVIYEDNQGCIALVKNPVAREKAKHIDIKVKYVSQQYKEGVLTPVPCPTEEMLADDLTKPVPVPTLEKHLGEYMDEYHDQYQTVEVEGECQKT